MKLWTPISKMKNVTLLKDTPFFVGYTGGLFFEEAWKVVYSGDNYVSKMMQNCISSIQNWSLTFTRPRYATLRAKIEFEGKGSRKEFKQLIERVKSVPDIEFLDIDFSYYIQVRSGSNALLIFDVSERGDGIYIGVYKNNELL